MKHSFLLVVLAISMAASAVTSVSVRDQKILLVQDGQETVLAPNGQDESYYWVSLSPDGQQILYSTAHHGTCVCDLNGNVLRSLGRLNAPKWMDNQRVSGSQEVYSDADPDLVDHTDYYCLDLQTQSRRALTQAETKQYIQQEAARQQAVRARHAARAAARRASLTNANDLTGLKIYINAGHGGHDPQNDRSVWTIPVPETGTNPNGYWESNSNLAKALALRDLLQSAGATVIMSRTTNNSGPRDLDYYSYSPGTAAYNALMAGDDRDFSSIDEEANANDVDEFLSIHSNAQNTTTNYLLQLYHGTDDNPTVANSDAMASSSFSILVQNPLTVWTSTAVRVRGDISFYGDKPTDPKAGLGVLRSLTVPGFLSEGSFHDYAPETHRLCNADYCKLEALRFFKHIHSYFGRTLPQTATISGFVKSLNEKVDVLNQPNFYYTPGTDDQWLPLNGAKVVLKDENGARLDSVVTDDWYNGIFAFYDLQPGTYQVEASLNNYKTETQTVTVVAEQIAAVKLRLRNISAGQTAAPNIYASGLHATQEGETMYIDYVLNAPATSLKVKFYNGDELIDEIAVTGDDNLSRGTHHGVAVNLSQLPAGSFSWALEATAEAHNDLREVLEQTTDYAFYGPRDVAVDNSPLSPYFGRVYVSSAQAGTTSENGVARLTTKGLYIFDALFSPENSTAYNGGITWMAEQALGTSTKDNNLNYGWGPYRLAIDEDGYVFVTDNGTANGSTTGVYMMDPAHPENTFQEVLNKSMVGSLFHRANAIAVTGRGANRVLYLNDYTDSIVNYPIGNSFPCSTKGATAVSNAAFQSVGFGNAQNSMARDNNGGFWVSQIASTTAKAQLAHFNAAGVCDYYISGSHNSSLSLSDSRRGVVGLNPSNTLVAFGGANRIKVLAINDINSVPSLTETDYSLPTNMGTNVDGIAFDVADNIYVVSASTERLRVFATPKPNNSYETPAPSTSIIHLEGFELNTLSTDKVISQLEGKTVRRVLAKDRYLFVLALDTQNNPYLYRIDTRTNEALSLPTGFCSVVDEGGLKLSDIALTADGVLVGCNKEKTAYSLSNYFNVYKWTETNGDFSGALWFTSRTNATSGNFTDAYTGETMTYSGTLAAGKMVVSARTTGSTTGAIRPHIITIANSAVASTTYNRTASPLTAAELGADYQLNVLADGETYVIDGSVSKPYTFTLINTTTTGTSVPTAFLNLTAPEAARAGYFMYGPYELALNPRFADTQTDGFVINDITGNEVALLHHNAEALQAMDATFAAAVGETYDGDAYIYLLRDNLLSVYTTALHDEITVSGVGYATYYNGALAYVMPDGVVGYVFSTALTPCLELAYEAGDIVPAGTGLVLEAAQGTYELEFTEGGEAPAENQLYGSDVATLTSDIVSGDYLYYGLSLAAAPHNTLTSVGFYFMEEEGAAFTNGAHKAFLAVPQGGDGVAPRFYLFHGENNATNLEDNSSPKVGEVPGGQRSMKLLRNGAVYIIRDGVTYDALGRVVK